MEISIIRDYLLNDNTIKTLVNENIFLLYKPLEIQVDTYIILNYKPLSGGVVKDWQLELRLRSKDIERLMQLQKQVISLLDFNRQKNIKGENSTIYHSQLLNGGGMVFDDIEQETEILVYFLLKI